MSVHYTCIESGLNPVIQVWETWGKWFDSAC